MSDEDRNEEPLLRYLTDTVVQYGRVLDVDIENYTVSVATIFARKVYTGISFATPYQHYVNGEGMYFMPEVGSMCWICEPSDHNQPFVIAWAPARNRGDFTANKLPLNPGDIYLGTRDENFVILRRGGVVQIGGGPLSQRIFMPINNTIKDLCENYSLQTIGGDLNWTVDREESTTDGKRPSYLTLSARQYANDKNPMGILKVGSHGDGSDVILSLSIKASADDKAATKVTASFDKNGKVVLDVKSSISISTTSTYSVAADGNISLVSKDEASIKGKTVSLTSDSEMSLKSGTDLKMSGSSIALTSSNIKIGGDLAVQAAILGDLFVEWAKSHTHTDTVTGAPTSPPTPPPLQMLSTTVKVAP